MQMTETTVGALYWAVLLLLLVGAALMKWFYERLKRRHHEVWMELGEPSLFLNASMLVQRRMANFLWSGAYKKLGDESLNKVATVLKVLAILTLLIVVLVFLAVGGLVL